MHDTGTLTPALSHRMGEGAGKESPGELSTILKTASRLTDGNAHEAAVYPAKPRALPIGRGTTVLAWVPIQKR